MTVINTCDGKPCFITNSGKFIRMYKYIDDTVSVDRARTQFKLVADMEEKENLMQAIVDKYFKV